MDNSISFLDPIFLDGDEKIFSSMSDSEPIILPTLARRKPGEANEEDDDDHLSLLDGALEMDMNFNDEDNDDRAGTSENESMDDEVAQGLRIVGLGLDTQDFEGHSGANPPLIPGLSLAELLDMEPKSKSNSEHSSSPRSETTSLHPLLTTPLSASFSSKLSSNAHHLNPKIPIEISELEKLFETEDEDIEQGIKSTHSHQFSSCSSDKIMFSRPPFKENRKQELLCLFPEYLKDSPISFTTMFGPTAISRLQPCSKKINALILSYKVETSGVMEDTKQRFELKFGSTMPFPKVSLAPPLVYPDHECDEYITSEILERLKKTIIPRSFESERRFMPVTIARWEEKVIWDEPPTAHTPPSAHDMFFNQSSVEMIYKLPSRNIVFDQPEWLLSTSLDLNSSHFFFSDGSCVFPFSELAMSRSEIVPPPSPPSEDSPFATDMFNLSNDEYYKIPKGPKTIRDATKLVLQHSPPALRLATAYFKTELQPRELRLFHRPRLLAHPGMRIEFCKLRTLKKKKIKGKDASELLKRPRDITMNDSINFTIFEYSEENPIILSNKGMASFIFNYYRKKDKKDSFIPNFDLGTPNVLEPNAPDPFWGFGDIEKGETLPVLVNNMICAPLFRHTPLETDFLLVRIQTKRSTRWYLRELSSIFTVGQMYPALEIAPPTSRVYTEYRRNRIRIAAFRLLKKRQEQAKRGVRFSELQVLFPHYAEVQLKSRLKEFMEGRGLQSGHWRLKGGAVVPSEEEIRKMVTPEQVCMYETMSAACRQLEDLGYSMDDTEISCSPELALEEELAPWKVTKNFAMAVAHKHFLKLEGKGDPTGCGEGFSFLRAAQREKFGKWVTDTSRVSNQEQWAAYKKKIKEIWNRQLRTLSNPTPLFEPFEQAFKNAGNSHSQGAGKWSLTSSSTYFSSKSATAHNNGHLEIASIPPRQYSKKYLCIKRRVKGSSEWLEEIVTDPRVISAYLKLKAQLENAGEGSAIDKFRRQKLLTEAKANRENQIQVVLRNSREVRCRRCGMLGHIKTNREKCSAWKPGDQDTGSKVGTPTRELLPDEPEGEDDEMVELEDFDYDKDARELTMFTPPRKRKHFNMQFSDLLVSILEGVMKMPEGQPFLYPFDTNVSPSRATPSNASMSLHLLMEKSKAFSYSTVEAFKQDLQLLQVHFTEHYGPDHPNVTAARKIVSITMSELDKRSYELKALAEQLEAGVLGKRHLSKTTGLEAIPAKRESTPAASASTALVYLLLDPEAAPTESQKPPPPSTPSATSALRKLSQSPTPNLTHVSPLTTLIHVSPLPNCAHATPMSASISASSLPNSMHASPLTSSIHASPLHKSDINVTNSIDVTDADKIDAPRSSLFQLSSPGPVFPDVGPKVTNSFYRAQDEDSEELIDVENF